MNDPAAVCESDLQAWVDDALPDARRAEIEAYLSGRPAEIRRLASYRAQNEALRRLYGPVLSEPVPPRLSEPAQPRARGPGPSARPWWARRAAAAAAFACVGAAAGWAARGELGGAALLAAAAPHQAGDAPAPAAALPRRAAIAHAVFSPDARRPVEIGAAQQDQLVAWLSKRIGTEVRPPRLGALGYELIGGRLLPGGEGPMAQFMYEDGAGRRLTVYVSTENAAGRDTAFRFAQQGPVNVFYWVGGRLGYAVSAGIERAELTRVATEVYQQLSF